MSAGGGRCPTAVGGVCMDGRRPATAVSPPCSGWQPSAADTGRPDTRLHRGSEWPQWTPHAAAGVHCGSRPEAPARTGGQRRPPAPTLLRATACPYPAQGYRGVRGGRCRPSDSRPLVGCDRMARQCSVASAATARPTGRRPVALPSPCGRAASDVALARVHRPPRPTPARPSDFWMNWLNKTM